MTVWFSKIGGMESGWGAANTVKRTELGHECSGQKVVVLFHHHDGGKV